MLINLWKGVLPAQDGSEEGYHGVSNGVIIVTFMRKGGLWISRKTVNFFHGHSVWIRIFHSLHTRIFHSWRETNHVAKGQWRLPRCDYLIGVNFHTVKHIEAEWNLTCFFFFFFVSPSTAFQTGKNKNTWSRQAKFGEVDPRKKLYFSQDIQAFLNSSWKK